jgi:hypothetical protein
MSRTSDRIRALEALLAPSIRVSLAAPVPDLSYEEWEQVAMAQQAALIASAISDVTRATANAAAKAQAEHAAKHPPTPQRKPTKPFVHVPSVFDTRA